MRGAGQAAQQLGVAAVQVFTRRFAQGPSGRSADQAVLLGRTTGPAFQHAA